MSPVRSLSLLPLLALIACGGNSPAEDAVTSEPMTDAAVPASAASAAAAPSDMESATPEATTSAAATPPPSASAATPAASPTATASAAAKTAPAAASTPAAPPMAFMQCRACHAVEPGKNGIGPTLAGIMGSKAGEVPGYAFSPALKASGITWTRASLDQWLQGPLKMVPGTKMVIGVSDAGKRKEIIDYLATLK